MLKNKLELTTERKTFLNRIIVFGSEESFIHYLENICRDFNYDTSHYQGTYERAKGYINEK